MTSTPKISKLTKISHKNVNDVYIYSSDGQNSYGAFNIQHEDMSLYCRLVFRYDIQNKTITDLVVPLRKSELFRGGALITGDMERVINYKRPNLSLMKMVFGGSPIEMFFLFFGFITFLLVLKNILTKKSVFFGSILSQLQLFLSCIGAYGICGIISFIGSISYNENNRRLLNVYINSLTELLINLFLLSGILFIIMLLKLRPIKQVKPWMYSNLFIIPGLTIGLIISIQKIIFG